MLGPRLIVLQEGGDPVDVHPTVPDVDVEGADRLPEVHEGVEC